MKVLLDSSTLIAAMLPDHVHHGPAHAWLSQASPERRRLRHEEFKTQGKRLGSVIQVSQVGIRYWRLNAEHEKRAGWSE